MKIIDVCEFFSDQGGGVRTYVHRKLEEAKRHGHDVVIVAPGAEDREERRLGGRILWVRSPGLPLDPRYRVLTGQDAIHAILDRERPDLVEASSTWFGGRAAASYPRAVTRTLIFHQDPVAVYPQTFLDGVLNPALIDRMLSPYWGYLRRLSASFDRTIVAGAWLEERLAAQGVERPLAVPFGIEKSRFDPSLRSESVRRELLAKCGVLPEGELLVVVGRHHPEKRIGTLIDAIRLARRAGHEIGLVVFGDGPQRVRVERRAAEAGNVHVAGFADDRDALALAVSSADLFVHGSAAETYGLVVAEALSCGVPIVVPNRGGAADLARDEYSETYPPGDALACAQAISRLLRRDRPSLRAAALRARDRVVRDVRDHFAALFDTYEQLNQERRFHGEDRVLRARSRQGTRDSRAFRSGQAA